MSKICLNWTISLLSGFFILFILSTFGFIFNISINACYLIFTSIAVVLILSVLTLKSGFTKKQLFAQLIILFDIVLIFGVIAYILPDFSYDGTTYHQAGIIWLKWGWNPVYQNLHEFAYNSKYLFKASIENSECFLKFFEIIGANIYFVFNKIELTKITNFIFMLTAFCYCFYSVKNYKNISNFWCVILSFLFVYNPVCIYQMHTNYVDCIFYYAFLILLFAMINFIKKEDETMSLFIILMTTVILANIKLTGFLTVGILYFTFLVVYKNKKIFLVGLISAFLILLTGINPYFTNLSKGRNPFYPVVKDSIMNANREFMITSYPTGFENMNRFKKFFISTFSPSKNISMLIAPNESLSLKFPLTITNDDLFTFEDMRLGGFGYLFSGILLIAFGLSFCLRFRKEEDKKVFLTIMAVMFLSVFGNHECWWARFIPQLWAYPLFVLMYLIINNQLNSINKKRFALIFVGICLLNSFLINVQYLNDKIHLTISYKNEIKNFKNHSVIITTQAKEQDNKLETLPVKLEEYGLVIETSKE